MVESRAQSETIGTILMTGVVVILVSVVTVTVIFDTDAVSQDRPVVTLDGAVTTSEVIVTHEGGDSLDNDDVVVVVGADDGSRRHRLGDANVTGSDGRFDPGDRFRKTHSITGKTATLTVVHEPSGTVLFEKPVDVGVSGGR